MIQNLSLLGPAPLPFKILPFSSILIQMNEVIKEEQKIFMPTRYTSKRPSLGRKSTQQHSIIHSCPQAQHSQYHVLFLFLFFLVTSYFVLLVNFSCWSFLTL